MVRQATLLKLPRSYYKKRAIPPAFRDPDKVYNATFYANLGHVGPGRMKSFTTLRKVLLQDLATGIVNTLRATHINITMGNPTGHGPSNVLGWKQYRAMGVLDGPVAILVDGSPQRPIKNVKFAGNITIVAQPDVVLMIKAATAAWSYMIRFAASKPHNAGYEGKKNNNYSYKAGFEMFVSDKTFVKSPGDLVKMEQDGTLTSDDWITIHNYVPYAAVYERNQYPGGVFWQAFKKVRSKFGRQLAVRFDFVESTDYSIKAQKGATIPIAQPVLRIGAPHLFSTRKPNMRKIKRDASKRGRG